jgi:hypothetical protein
MQLALPEWLCLLGVLAGRVEGRAQQTQSPPAMERMDSSLVVVVAVAAHGGARRLVRELLERAALVVAALSL